MSASPACHVCGTDLTDAVCFGYGGHLFCTAECMRKWQWVTVNEITPEMIAAGADVLVYLLRDGENPKDVATAVFEAMLSAFESRLHQPQEV